MTKNKILAVAILTFFSGLAHAATDASLQIQCSVSDNSGPFFSSAKVISGQSSNLDFKSSKYFGAVSYIAGLQDLKHILTVTVRDSEQVESASESMSLYTTRVEAGSQVATRHIKMNGTKPEVIELNCTVKSISP